MKFLNINFTGIREILFDKLILRLIPANVAKDNYTLVIMTGEEEIHYYTAILRVNWIEY